MKLGAESASGLGCQVRRYSIPNIIWCVIYDIVCCVQKLEIVNSEDKHLYDEDILDMATIY